MKLSPIRIFFLGDFFLKNTGRDRKFEESSSKSFFKVNFTWYWGRSKSLVCVNCVWSFILLLALNTLPLSRTIRFWLSHSQTVGQSHSLEFNKQFARQGISPILSSTRLCFSVLQFCSSLYSKALSAEFQNSFLMYSSQALHTNLLERKSSIPRARNIFSNTWGTFLQISFDMRSHLLLRCFISECWGLTVFGSEQVLTPTSTQYDTGATLTDNELF